MANLECLDRFWRGVIPRKIRPELITRRCAFFHGAPLMNIYRNEELGYAVACLHYGFAMMLLQGDTRFFWKHIMEFMTASVQFRAVPFNRSFHLLLHVIESLAWSSKEGQLFPMPAVVWFLIDGFILQNGIARMTVAGIELKEFKWIDDDSTEVL
jgi:hypothetical protein